MLKNELFYASPADMNDPFDCKVPIDYNQLDTEEKRLRYAKGVIKDALPILSTQRISVDQKIKEVLFRLEHDKEKFEDEWDLTNFRFTDMRFGVISFSQRWDSILMWSHYAENHKGFCLGLNRERFVKSGLFGTAGAVDYKEDYPLINLIEQDPIKEVFDVTHTKARDWSYEEEFRATFLWETNPTLEERKVNFDDDLIEELILGLFISDAHKEQILHISTQRKIPVYGVIKKRKKLVLDRVRLV